MENGRAEPFSAHGFQPMIHCWEFVATYQFRNVQSVGNRSQSGKSMTPNTYQARLSTGKSNSRRKIFFSFNVHPTRRSGLIQLQLGRGALRLNTYTDSVELAGAQDKILHRSAGLHPAVCAISNPQTLANSASVENPAPSRLEIAIPQIWKSALRRILSCTVTQIGRQTEPQLTCQPPDQTRRVQKLYQFTHPLSRRVASRQAV